MILGSPNHWVQATPGSALGGLVAPWPGAPDPDSLGALTSKMQSDNENAIRAIVHVMRYNLLWYLPVAAWVVWYFIVPNVASGYQNVRLVFHHFTWAIFFSPSAYIFFSAVILSIFLPFRLLLFIPLLFVPDVQTYKRRYVWSFGIVVVIVISALLIQGVIWGSFPLPASKDGYIHLRMIPFIPWPE
jgi:hypothetical protein